MATEPEHELIRRVLPFTLPAFGLALALGYVLGGWSAAMSAAIGVLIVAANFALNAWALGRAAKHSITAYSAVAMLGFVARLAVILGIMFALNTVEGFSPVAFAIAVLPSTVLLLAFEMKLISGPLGNQWRIPESGAASTTVAVAPTSDLGVSL